MTLQFDFSTTELAAPVNGRAAVLKGLIDHSFISERDFNMNGFRMRLTEIRRELASEGIEVHYGMQDFVNEFGNAGSFRKHYLHMIDKDKAKEVFNKINVR
jgi:hypothetical protein